MLLFFFFFNQTLKMYCTSLFFKEFVFPVNKVLAVFPVRVVNVNFCEDGSSRFAVLSDLQI